MVLITQPFPDFYSSFIHLVKGKEYTDRVCCENGGTVPSDSCAASPAATPGSSSSGILLELKGADFSSESESSGSSIGIIVGAVAAVVVVVLLALLVFVWKRNSNRSGEYRTTIVPVAVAVAAPDMAGSTANNRAERDIEMLNHFDSSMSVPAAEAAPTAPSAFNPLFDPSG